jgi:hypothetical protein
MCGLSEWQDRFPNFTVIHVCKALDSFIQFFPTKLYWHSISQMFYPTYLFWNSDGVYVCVFFKVLCFLWGAKCLYHGTIVPPISLMSRYQRSSMISELCNSLFDVEQFVWFTTSLRIPSPRTSVCVFVSVQACKFCK